MSETQNATPQAVLQALTSRNNDTIRQAAFDAGDMLFAEAIPSLSLHIKSRNVGVQEAAEYALRKIRGPQAVQAMLPYLYDDDSCLRNVAMDILREIGSDDIAILCPMLKNTDPDIRIFMADILGHTKDQRAVAPLCEALLRDPEVNVRYQAAMSLGQLAFPEAAVALHRAMQDEEWVQFSVVEALTKIRADSAINTLVQSLSTSSALVASIIIDALGTMKNIKAVPLLLKYIEKTPGLLKHKTVKTIVQILGAESLCLIASSEQPKFKKYLEQALLEEDDEDSREIILQGLSVMGDAESSKVIIEFFDKYPCEYDSKLYQEGIKSLVDIGYNDTLASFLLPSNKSTVPISIYACARIQDRKVVLKLKEIFWDVERDSQRIIADCVANQVSNDDIDFFLKILEKCKDGSIIKSALTSLGQKLKYTDAEDIIITFLDHPYIDVKKKAIEACIQLNTLKTNSIFTKWTTEGNSDQRAMGVYALGILGLQKNYSAIKIALDDDDFTVRQIAIESFAQEGTNIKNYLDVLIPKLKDEVAEVRATTINVLSNSQDISVVPHLINALNDKNEWVCIRAIEALLALNADKLITILHKKLETSSPMITLKIIDVLTIIGGETAFRILLSLAQNDIAEIQQSAIDAIAKVQAV